MFLHSASASYAVSQFFWAPPVLCPCEVGKIGNGTYYWLGGRSAALFLRCKACWRRCTCKACMLPSDRGKNELNFKFYDPAKKSLKSQKLLVVGQFSDELEYGEESAKKPVQMVSNFTNYREDPLVDKLRSQLGVIHPIPAPPINKNVVGLFVFFFFVGVIFDKLWTSRTRKKENRDARSGIWPQVPSSFSLFLEKDLQRKESVEWVNMVLGKLWKVYREGIENWITGLLQPVIDNLQKPDYVQRVEIKQFSLGEEPLSVRTVERRTSRHANDLQYQIGLRYTGGARALLSLSLNFGIIPVSVPVGIRDFDIDGELWVKLRLIPTEPWVGAVSWAFVSLPKIKFVLSPFRLFNLMAIPVLSMFLRKLLTEDLPRLFVRPKKIVLDFRTGTSVGPVSDDFKTGAAQEGNNDFKTGAAQEGNKDYVGELSVTLVDAQKLAFVFWGKTDPYVVLTLGDQVIRSKKNSQTTVIGPPGQPIWNQDFHLLVTNPRRQRLFIQVRDSFGFTDFTIGTAEVELGSLQDTVPTDRIINLQGGWGLFQGGSSGEVLLRLTYKAYVEDEEDDVTLKEVLDGYLSDDEGSDTDETDDEYLQNRWDISGATEKESFIDLLAALLVSEEFQGIVSSETGYTKPSEETSNLVSGSSTELTNVETEDSSDSSGGSPLFWFAVITGLTVLASFNVGGSSLFNP